MKNALEWLKEHELICNVSLSEILALQNDARKDGLMAAQGIASDVINRESYKYATPDQLPPAEMTLSGLNFFVSAAITSEGDKLNYLPGKKE